MCAIVDTGVAAEVFGVDRPEAGLKFFDWINGGSGRLVLGGELREELNRTPAREWAQQALNAGLIRNVNDSDVKTRTEQLRNEGSCKSNDPHVIALAQLSGARLLYANDDKLKNDFKNRKLIDNPGGKVYTTQVQGKERDRRLRDGTFRDKGFRPNHQRLLRETVCAARERR